MNNSDHIVGVWLDSAGPNPGALLPDGAEPDPVFSVERGLFVGTAHHDVLALREEADAAGVEAQWPVLPDLQKHGNTLVIKSSYTQGAQTYFWSHFTIKIIVEVKEV